MNASLIPATIFEVPAGTDPSTCMPMVVMQPTAETGLYMLTTQYATNGAPGVVDKAVVSESTLTIPIHGIQHLQAGDDPIPTVTLLSDGLMPAGSGRATDYFGGDLQYHPLNAQPSLFSEGQINLTPGTPTGAVLFSGVIPNAAAGVYYVDYAYFYNANPSSPPAGTMHLEVYDIVSASYIQVTNSTDVSVLTASNILLRPILLSIALTKLFPAAPNALTWRVVLDSAAGVTASFQVGFKFGVTALQSL
jgi:hypothetical protein